MENYKAFLYGITRKQLCLLHNLMCSCAGLIPDPPHGGYIKVFIVLCSCMLCIDICHGSEFFLKPSECNTALITQVKRYRVYHYKKDKILCEPYRVSKNDWLYKIFKKKGEISENNFPLFINMFKTINPNINNIDAIHPGQVILIPLKRIHTNDFKETRPGVVDVPVIEFTHIPVKLKPFIKSHRIKKGETISQLLDSVFLNKDGTINAMGMRALKLSNPKIKNVNLIYAGSLMNLPSGSLSLQPWFRSSFPVATDIQAVNRNAEKIKKITDKKKKEKRTGNSSSILKVSYSIKSILKRYTEMVGGKALQTGKFYFPRDNNPDFILDLRSTPVIELVNGKKILIVPDKKTGTSLSKIIHFFWKNIEILTFDKAALSLNMDNTLLTDRKKQNHSNRNKLLEIDTKKIFPIANYEAAVKKLISFTDFQYIPNAQISLSQGSLHFSVYLGKIYKKGLPDLLVDFGNMYGSAFDIIRKKGFKIISFSSKNSFQASILKLCACLDMQVTKNPVFISAKTKNAITIHGLYVTGNMQAILIAEQEPDKETTDFLNQEKIKLLYLKNSTFGLKL